jgi:hypothetical protein
MCLQGAYAYIKRRKDAGNDYLPERLKRYVDSRIQEECGQVADFLQLRDMLWSWLECTIAAREDALIVEKIIRYM